MRTKVFAFSFSDYYGYEMMMQKNLRKFSAGLALAVLFLCNAYSVRGQYELKIIPVDSAETMLMDQLTRDIKTGKVFKDSLKRFQEVRKLISTLHANGYLGASIDRIEYSGNQQTIHLRLGTLFRWVHLSSGNVDEGIQSEAGFREKIYRNKPVRSKALAGIHERLLTWCDNHGYPFAEVRFDSIRIDSGLVSSSIKLQKNQLVIIDSIVVKGSSKLSGIYLNNYLSIKPGRAYNESLIKRIPNRIKELPMVSEGRPFGITFRDDRATLFLYLENRRASQFDGIVGVLPDNNNTGKINISGDVHIKLLSAFGYGELFDLNWKQPFPETQDFKVKFNYPFLFSTPFGIDLNLFIYKKDSTYLELNRNAGVQYLLSGGNFIKAFYNNKKSSLINTKAFENSSVLPPFADIKINSYGLSLHSEKLDYRLNPKSGYAAEITGSVGQKTIQKNPKLKFVNYDSLKLNSTQYHSTLSADYYFPVWNNFVLNIGTLSGFLVGDETFQNELYRIGGLKSLRGFDEESILASSYIIWKAEYRYLLEQNSYLFLFVNGAWYERKQRNYFLTDTPFGFGAGITFETKLGIFSLNYALGKEFQNPILFRAAKVHFGLINYF